MSAAIQADRCVRWREQTCRVLSTHEGGQVVRIKPGLDLPLYVMVQEVEACEMTVQRRRHVGYWPPVFGKGKR